MQPLVGNRYPVTPTALSARSWCREVYMSSLTPSFRVFNDRVFMPVFKE